MKRRHLMDINDINILLEPYQPWQISFVIAFVIAIILIVILLVATVKLLLRVSDKDQNISSLKETLEERDFLIKLARELLDRGIPVRNFGDKIRIGSSLEISISYFDFVKITYLENKIFPEIFIRQSNWIAETMANQIIVILKLTVPEALRVINGQGEGEKES
ncbi:MAG TPA: hypothetical protein PLA19_00920 [Candidatus Pacearchaeota archaeon]|nr:hypothetical protein [Candidatus Pacearchaeota archaeon]